MLANHFKFAIVTSLGRASAFIDGSTSVGWLVITITVASSSVPAAAAVGRLIRVMSRRRPMTNDDDYDDDQ